MRNTDIYI